MRERMCRWQGTILETSLNVHVSRCENRLSEFLYNPVHKERCENCPHRVPVPEDDEATASLKPYIFIDLDERPAEEVDKLLETHCKQCDFYRPGPGMCSNVSCQHHIPIRDLMKNPETHCSMGKW